MGETALRASHLGSHHSNREFQQQGGGVCTEGPGDKGLLWWHRPQMALQALQVLFQQLSLAWGVGMAPGEAQSFSQTNFHSKVPRSGLSDQRKLHF